MFVQPRDGGGNLCKQKRGLSSKYSFSWPRNNSGGLLNQKSPKRNYLSRPLTSRNKNGQIIHVWKLKNTNKKLSRFFDLGSWKWTDIVHTHVVLVGPVWKLKELSEIIQEAFWPQTIKEEIYRILTCHSTCEGPHEMENVNVENFPASNSNVTSDLFETSTMKIVNVEKLSSLPFKCDLSFYLRPQILQRQPRRKTNLKVFMEEK